MLEEIESLVRNILNDHGEPWPTDITDQVFLAIERDPERCELYWRVVRELDAQGKKGQQVVNQYIGRRVRQLTTDVNRGRCGSPRSLLIKSYEKH
ncbi:MAG: hypothetical protein E3J21_05280 [Anaerolineales bacterium]|nr:MAG: hypothetical protein E3J21_05280 [Anaerolineales bacterium]